MHKWVCYGNCTYAQVSEGQGARRWAGGVRLCLSYVDCSFPVGCRSHGLSDDEDLGAAVNPEPH